MKKLLILLPLALLLLTGCDSTNDIKNTHSLTLTTYQEIRVNPLLGTTFSSYKKTVSELKFYFDKQEIWAKDFIDGYSKTFTIISDNYNPSNQSRTLQIGDEDGRVAFTLILGKIKEEFTDKELYGVIMIFSPSKSYIFEGNALVYIAKLGGYSNENQNEVASFCQSNGGERLKTYMNKLILSRDSSSSSSDDSNSKNDKNSYNNSSTRQNYFDETFPGKWLITEYKPDDSEPESFSSDDDTEADTVYLQKYSDSLFSVTGHFPNLQDGTTQMIVLTQCESDLCQLNKKGHSFRVSSDDDKLKLTYETTGSELSKDGIKQVTLTLERVKN